MPGTRAVHNDAAERLEVSESRRGAVERYKTLIAEDVGRNTRKLDTTEAFTVGIYERRAFLLSHLEIARLK
jgi:hypothetical protein